MKDKDIEMVFTVPDESLGDALIDLYLTFKESNLLDYFKPSADFNANGKPLRIYVNDVSLRPKDVVVVDKNDNLEVTDMTYAEALEIIENNEDEDYGSNDYPEAQVTDHFIFDESGDSLADAIESITLLYHLGYTDIEVKTWDNYDDCEA